MFRSKKFSLLMALVFAFTVIFPFGVAFADTTYVDFSKSYKYISTGDGVYAGTASATYKDNDGSVTSVYYELTLPEGVEFSETVDEVENFITPSGKFGFDKADSTSVRVYESGSAGFAFTGITFDFANYANSEGEGWLNIDDDFSGNLEVTLEVIGVDGSGSIIWTESDELIIAKVSSSDVTVTADDPIKVSVGGNKEVADITVEESMAGALSTSDVIYLEIVTDGVTFEAVTPDASGVTLGNEKGNYTNTEIYWVEINGASKTFPGEIEFDIRLNIDPDVTGDIEIDVYSNYDNTNLEDETVTVATVGDTTINLKDLDDNDTVVYIGQTKELDVSFTIATADGSAFSAGDIITFRLNKGEFAAEPEVENSTSNVKRYDDNEAFYYTIPPSNTKDELDIDEIKIKLDNSDEPGDITLSIAGDYGELEDVVIGQAVMPFTVTAEKAEIVTEALAQEAGDIIITEADGGALEKGTILVFELPSGVELSSKPKVEVEEGTVDASVYAYNDEVFKIKIDKESSKDPGVIRIYNLQYDTGRLALAGDVELEIYTETDDDIIATVANATVVDEKVVTASFTLGDEGVAIQNGRMLVQVNTLCEVLGLQKSWDAANKVAYFVKNGTVVAFPIDQNKIIINGNEIPVDQGGTIINGFTYATLRGIQMAFGGELSWDNVTKTAAFEFQK